MSAAKTTQRKTKRQQTITREDVLVACRTRFGERWGRPFDGWDAGYVSTWITMDEGSRAHEDDARKRYRALRDAYRSAARFVEEHDPVRDGVHGRLLRAYVPRLKVALDGIHDVLERATADGLIGRRRDWEPWLEHVKERFATEDPHDLAVLRLLSGYWDFEPSQLAKFRTAEDAISAVAKRVRDATK